MSGKHKNVCKPLNYFQNFLVFVSVGISSSEVTLKICEITTGIKTYKPLIKKRGKCIMK